LNTYKIVLIGAGKVAWHLSQELSRVHHPVYQVVNRTLTHLDGWTEWATTISGLEDIDQTADLYILSVSDHAIATVAEQISPYLPKEAFIVHTSGDTPSTVLAEYFDQVGVFYPLQTFSKAKAVNFQEIPICIYANHPNGEQILRTVASWLAPNEHIFPIDDEQRASLHVAAVFVNNFVNHLYQIGHQLTNDFDVPFALLRPLIAETAQKSQGLSPMEAQTGPAIRGDHATLEKHLGRLENYPYFRQLYQLMSEQILKQGT